MQQNTFRRHRDTIIVDYTIGDYTRYDEIKFFPWVALKTINKHSMTLQRISNKTQRCLFEDIKEAADLLTRATVSQKYCRGSFHSHD